MIYCKLKKLNENSAVYQFGRSTEDMTGEIVFYSSFVLPTVVKQPDAGNVPSSILSNVVIKYRESFERKKFPDKLCFER